MGKFDSYIICTSPRSGSTLLLRLLAATGVAGNPDSYFHKPEIEHWLEGLELSPEASSSELDVLNLIFGAAKSKGTLNTQIFGLRLQRPSFEFFIEQLGKLHPECFTDRQRIESEFNSVRFIHLTRLDKVSQAISLFKAEQTGLWHIAPDGTELERLSPPRPVTYDAVVINERLEELIDNDRGWVDWFRNEQIEPLRITYEELSLNPTGMLNRVLTNLGIDGKSVVNVKPEVAKMSDRMSREWARRFRSEFDSEFIPEYKSDFELKKPET